MFCGKNTELLLRGSISCDWQLWSNPGAWPVSCAITFRAFAARKAAESLAQEAIATRVALVGAIGEAEAELAAIDAARIEAEDTIRLAHERAIAGGWTVKELAAMGYNAPKKKKAAAGGKRTSSVPVVDTAAANAPQRSEENPPHDSSD